MNSYKSELQERNEQRQSEKIIRIESIKNIIKNWQPNLDLEDLNEINKAKTYFEKSVKTLKELGYISSKKDFANKITKLKDELDYSFDEIGTAISEFIKSINPTQEVINLHKQTISRIIKAEKQEQK